MKLIPEWKVVVTKAWSFRLAVASALLSGVDFMLPYLTPEHPTRGFAVGAGIFASLSALSRLIIQYKLRAESAVAAAKKR